LDNITEITADDGVDVDSTIDTDPTNDIYKDDVIDENGE